MAAKTSTIARGWRSWRRVSGISRRYHSETDRAFPVKRLRKRRPVSLKSRVSISRPRRYSRRICASPRRTSSPDSNVTATMANQSTSSFPQKIRIVSPWRRNATGTTTKEARRFAARMVVAWTEITIAEDTISTAWANVSRKIKASI